MPRTSARVFLERPLRGVHEVAAVIICGGASPALALFLTGIAASPMVGFMSDTERAELRGTVLDGRYQLEGVIGTGGTGVVFDATRITDLEPVVIKTLRGRYASSPELARRLLREVEVADRVAHPGVAPAIDQGYLSDGSPYVVQKRLHGDSLAQLLRRYGSLPIAETATIALRVSSILHHVHAAGFVHRDVKPEHILLDRTADGALLVQLLDFGICASKTASEEEKNAERGRVFGTPSYASPEQAYGDPFVDARADIFGLGVVVFECLTGRLPHRARNVNALLRRIIREDAPRVGLLVPTVGRDLDGLVARAIARVPAARFPSARAFGRALLRYVGDRRDTERHLASCLRAVSSVPAAA